MSGENSKTEGETCFVTLKLSTCKRSHMSAELDTYSNVSKGIRATRWEVEVLEIAREDACYEM